MPGARGGSKPTLAGDDPSATWSGRHDLPEISRPALRRLLAPAESAVAGRHRTTMILLAGAATAILIWWIVKGLTTGRPAAMKRLARAAGGVVALGAAGLLALRGRLDMALLVGGGGAWLLGWGALPAAFAGWRLPGLGSAAGPVSRLRSRNLEIEIDGRTGSISGTVLAGGAAGRRLDALSGPELAALRRDLLAGDPGGIWLLEAYLDGRDPGWREHAEPHPDRGREADAKLGPMSQQEAHEILGLQPGADAAAIRDAHRELMKRLHPDRGGSTYLASRVNQAKDVLSDRHR